MSLDPTCKEEWLAARERLESYSNPHTLDELIEAVIGPCPPEPALPLWRLGGIGSQIRIDPVREEWLAAKDRVAALWLRTTAGEIHWDEVAEAILGPCPPCRR
jgi:hypothetical protein